MTEQKSFTDYLALLLRHQRFLIITTLVIAAITAVISFVLPKWYRADSVILAPSEDFSLFPSSNLSRLNLSNLSLTPGVEKLERYTAILESRSITDQVIQKFDLINVYEVDDLEDARKELAANTEFEIEEEGTVHVSVWDKSKERVTLMTNYFVFALDSINRLLNSKEARFKRIAIENRYEQNIRDMKKAENDFKIFQEENDILSLPEQAEVTIQATAELIAQTSLLKLELRVKEKSLGSSHSDIRKIKSRLQETETQLRHLMEQENTAIDGLESSEEDKIFIPFKKFPELSIEYISLKRNLEAQMQIFELLTEQLEMAKLMETKDTPTIQILDYAVPPIKKAWPKRMLIVLVAAISSFILSVVVIILKEYVDTVKQELRNKQL